MLTALHCMLVIVAYIWTAWELGSGIILQRPWSELGIIIIWVPYSAPRAANVRILLSYLCKLRRMKNAINLPFELLYVF